MTVTAFASQLEHPRWLYVLPNGDVLVAETNAPPSPEANTGIKGANSQAKLATFDLSGDVVKDILV